MSRLLTTALLTTVVLGGARAALAQGAAGCFLGASESRYGNAARIAGDLGTNAPGGVLVLGRRSVVEAGSTASADTVRLGNGSQVAAVASNQLEGTKAAVGQQGPVALPLLADFCLVPMVACGGEAVVVRKQASMPLPPGAYGDLVLQNGATLLLGPGTYQFCSIRGGRRATLRTTGATTMNVQDNVRLGNGSTIGPEGSDPLPTVNIRGKRAMLGAKSHVAALVSAPGAQLLLGRGLDWRGTFCAARVAAGPHVKLACEQPAPPTTTTEPSTTTTSSSTTTTESSTTTTSSSTTSMTASTTTTTSTTVSTSTTTTSSTTSTTATSTTITTTTTTTTSPTVSTTGTVPTTTTTTSSTSTTTTTSMTVPTTTTTSSTTTTTQPQLVTCGPNGLDVTVNLDYEPRITGGVFGMFLELDYPSAVSIPGSGTASSARARFTNLIGSNYRFIPQDLDTDSDGVDDRGRTLVTANTSLEIPAAPIERIRFDCLADTVVETSQFACRPVDLSDASGMLFPPEVAAQITCALDFAVP
jgi:hypothetical protein